MEQQQRQPEDKQPLPPRQQQSPRLQCPRCGSHDTKFCYYNNYSLTQPRHFCRTCKRFWTQGGTLRNVPEGGRRKKAKTDPSSLAASSSSGKAPITHAGILENQVPVFAGGVGINSFHAYYYHSAGSRSAFGRQSGDLNPGAMTDNLSENPQAMAPDLCIMRPLLEFHLQQLVHQPPQTSLPVTQNLMSNGGQGQPHPTGWPLQQVGSQQQLAVTPAFATAPVTSVAPAFVPAPSSDTADSEVPNWDCILDPSVSLTRPSPPPPSSSSM